MKDLVFIIPLTPSKYLSPLRKDLLKVCLQSLRSQSTSNWQALLIGEEEKRDGNLYFVRSNAEKKWEKMNVAIQILRDLPKKPKYVVRLDDDDLISPTLLSKISNMDFDCFADLHHAFYDIRAGRFCQQRRSWLANTVIHKYLHAMTAYGEHGVPLLNHEHTKFHEYYKDKKLVYAPKNTPIYLRVLSPTTLTSGVNDQILNSSFGAYNIAVKKYNDYVKGFGKWSREPIQGFEAYIPELTTAWQCSPYSEAIHDSMLGRLLHHIHFK